MKNHITWSEVNGRILGNISFHPTNEAKLGLRIGLENQNKIWKVVIQNVSEEGYAREIGDIAVGDAITSWNGISFEKMTKEAIKDAINDLKREKTINLTILKETELSGDPPESPRRPIPCGPGQILTRSMLASAYYGKIYLMFIFNPRGNLSVTIGRQIFLKGQEKVSIELCLMDEAVVIQKIRSRTNKTVKFMAECGYNLLVVECKSVGCAIISLKEIKRESGGWFFLYHNSGGKLSFLYAEEMYFRALSKSAEGM